MRMSTPAPAPPPMPPALEPEPAPVPQPPIDPDEHLFTGRPSSRRKRNSSRVNAIISLTFHIFLVGVALLFAAREGYLGKKLRCLAVVVVPKEPKKPEPPKPKPQEAKKEAPKEAPKQVANTRAVAPAPARSATAPPPMVAPAAAGTTLPAFDFQGGKDTAPGVVYKESVEYALRTRWNKPEGINDATYVAEVNLSVDPAGKIVGYDWIKGSNDKRWDD